MVAVAIVPRAWSAVMRPALTVAVAGLAIGTLIAGLGAPALRPLTYGASPVHASTLGGLSAALGIVLAALGLFAWRRIATLDLARALSEP